MAWSKRKAKCYTTRQSRTIRFGQASPVGPKLIGMVAC